MSHDLITVRFHNFSGDRTEKIRACKQLYKVRVGITKADLQRVPIQRSQAFNLNVIRKWSSFLQRAASKLVQSEDLELLQAGHDRALPAWVEEPFQRIHEVLRNQFALHALECRIVLKENSTADRKRKDAKISRNLW